jgi:hypothetical protein
MTAKVQRPITSHPAFATLIALWAAAVLGLTVAVLPAAVLERWLASAGLTDFAPLTASLRAAVGATAAIVGGLLGYALARRLIRYAGRDPRPVYSEADVDYSEYAGEPPLRRRPLHVREELADGFGDESQVMQAPAQEVEIAQSLPPVSAAEKQAGDGFMILTPQPIHPPRPAPDLETLLEQFDSAFAAFKTREERRGAGGNERAGADPVQTFVARQRAAQDRSPIGGLVPDHQAELRAALDKLAKSQRG